MKIGQASCLTKTNIYSFPVLEDCFPLYTKRLLDLQTKFSGNSKRRNYYYQIWSPFLVIKTVALFGQRIQYICSLLALISLYPCDELTGFLKMNSTVRRSLVKMKHLYLFVSVIVLLFLFGSSEVLIAGELQKNKLGYGFKRGLVAGKDYVPG